MDGLRLLGFTFLACIYVGWLAILRGHLAVGLATEMLSTVGLLIVLGRR